MQARTIVDLLEHHRREYPDRIAFIDGNQRYTYAQFADLCDRATYWLQKQGIGQSDRVAVWLVNRMEWLVLLFGLSALGATLVTSIHGSARMRCLTSWKNPKPAC